MAPRIELQSLLETILGSKSVYFQPKPDFRMSYPCIRYSLATADKLNANNDPYSIQKAYSVIVLDRNPDSDIPNRILNLRMCTLEQVYVVDGLNHFVFNLYF